MKKQFSPQYNIGDEVQLKTEPGKRIITGYIVRKRQVSYFVALGDSEFCHQGVELEKYKEKRSGFK